MLKKWMFLLLLTLSVVMLPPIGGTWARSAIQLTDQQSFVKIAKEAMPAVVNISTTRVVKNVGVPEQFRNFFGDEFMKRFFDIPQQNSKQTSLGSGVIVDKRGYILTNNHVIDGADDILVRLNDAREFKGKVIGADPKTDIAVIKIDTDNLTEISMGDSEKIEVGQWAVAIGSPFGFTQTMTVGIISAKGRSRVGLVDYENFIQTDAAINPGNSGGALLNIDGELIGINTAIFSRTGGYEGIGFAIPVNMAKSIMTDLINDGKIVRGWLGVYIQSIDEKLSKQLGLNAKEGALITDITPDGPAEKAKLKRGDVILKFDNRSVKDTDELRNLVAATKVGKEVPLQIVRSGQQKQVILKVGQLKDDTTAALANQQVPSNKLGLKGESLTDQNLSNFAPGTKGVVVTDVDENGPADKAGIKKGDLIVELDHQLVAELDSLNAMLEKAKQGDSLLVCVKRDRYNYYLVVELEK